MRDSHIMSADMSVSKVCIVGAGPSSLALARTLKLMGISYDQFEKHSDVGGIWDRTNEGSPVYRSTHFISSKTLSGYTGFPMPDEFPDYPRHDQILDYLHDFADTFDLRENIQFGTRVNHAELIDGVWQVELSDGTTRTYKYLVCANGHTWDPSMPDIAGESSGEIIHAVQYRDESQLRGKRVLVVGAGNSGCDIACDAAANADAAFISMRRGYHFLPKHIYGMPADVFLSQGPELPMEEAQKALADVTNTLNGDLERYGLPKPDHEILETHPIVNSQLLHYLSHGDIEVRGDIDRFEGEEVKFKDGRSENIDLTIFATGYKYSIPYLDEGLFEWRGYKPVLSYFVFHPEISNLFFTGFVELNSGGYFLYDRMASVIANAILDKEADSAKVAELDRLKGRPIDYSGGIDFVDTSERMVNYADSSSFQRELAALEGQLSWQPPTPDAYTPGGFTKLMSEKVPAA